MSQYSKNTARACVYSKKYAYICMILCNELRNLKILKL